MQREIRKRYRNLLNTREWVEFSKQCILEAGNQCYLCESSEGLQVHHLRYRDVPPWEYHPNEVRVLCRDCHECLHKVADYIWVECLRFEPHELEIVLKRLQQAGGKRPNITEDSDTFSRISEILSGAKFETTHEL